MDASIEARSSQRGARKLLARAHFGDIDPGPTEKPPLPRPKPVVAGLVGASHDLLDAPTRPIH